MQVIRNCSLFKIARLLTGVCYDSHRVGTVVGIADRANFRAGGACQGHLGA